jgi:hypothetical protein
MTTTGASREDLVKRMVGFADVEDRIWLIHTPEFVGAIADYDDKLVGYDQRLASLDPLIFSYGGNAYHIINRLAPQKGWRVEEVPRC